MVREQKVRHNNISDGKPMGEYKVQSIALNMSGAFDPLDQVKRVNEVEKLLR